MKRAEIKRKGWQWAPVPSKLITSDKLDGNSIRLYAYLLWRAGSDMTAWPGVDTMAKDCHISERETRRALSLLVKDNWIHRQRRMSSSSITYVFERQSDCVEFRSQAAGGLTDRPPEAELTGHRRPEELEPIELEPKPSGARKERAPRALTPLQEEQKKLESLFSELSGRPIPPGKAATIWHITTAAWVKALNGRSEEIMRAAYAAHTAPPQRLSVKGPQSIDYKFWELAQTGAGDHTREL